MRETRDVAEKDQDHGGARALAVITASLLVPFPLNALLFVICHELEQWSGVSLYLDFLPVFVSTAVGFYFPARRFRRYAVAIAIVYIRSCSSRSYSSG